jgi:hypothetical protein
MLLSYVRLVKGQYLATSHSLGDPFVESRVVIRDSYAAELVNKQAENRRDGRTGSHTS